MSPPFRFLRTEYNETFLCFEEDDACVSVPKDLSALAFLSRPMEVGDTLAVQVIGDKACEMKIWFNFTHCDSRSLRSNADHLFNICGSEASTAECGSKAFGSGYTKVKDGSVIRIQRRASTIVISLDGQASARKLSDSTPFLTPYVRLSGDSSSSNVSKLRILSTSGARAPENQRPSLGAVAGGEDQLQELRDRVQQQGHALTSLASEVKMVRKLLMHIVSRVSKQDDESASESTDQDARINERQSTRSGSSWDFVRKELDSLSRAYARRKESD